MTAALAMAAPLEIGFCVRDLDMSLRFWRDALGLMVVADVRTTEEAAMASGFALSGYRVMRLELPTGERVKLFSPDRLHPRPKELTRPPLAQPGFAFVTLIVTDIVDTLARLGRHGVAPRVPVLELRPGIQVALVDDPDGNVVELVQYADIAAYRAPSRQG